MKKNTVFILAGTCLCYSIFTSCDKSKSENIDFTVSPADVVFTLDSLTDSINGPDTFYIASANLNLDFFRSACDQENVYLDDVKSVTIIKADLSVSSSSVTDFNAFSKINLQGTSSSYSPIELANLNSIGSSDSLHVSLVTNSTNLYSYFRLHDFNLRFVIGKKTTDTINPVSMTFKPQFKVNGDNH